ncbi:response regulator [Nannocystis pusilla]|uniref:response regulator n=1 Tax=Nannocystis pusilla TaxID=889268 RepID=UPI003BF27451
MTAAPSSSGVKILVADDSPGERATARSVLTEAGFAVVEATDGQQVLELYNRERPALVMLDVVMPKIGGLEVCRILKAKASGFLPVLMVSTRNSVNARVEGLRSGADDYLGKPYNPEELRARIDVLLRTRAQFSQGEGAEGDGPRARRVELAPDEFRRRLREEFERAERYSDPLACLRVEVDEGGEGARSAVELTPALHAIIEGNVRKIDLVHRTDDRGFLLVLPNTHFPGALTVAERVAREARRPLLHPSAARAAAANGFSVSIGVSFYPNKDTRSLQDLLDLVDAALERARREQGGKICLFQHQGYLYSPDD